MNENSKKIIPFSFRGNNIRAIMVNGEPWFVARDVCTVLEIADHTTATRDLDPDEKGTHTVRTPGGKQNLTIISESGLYALIFKSRKPEAKTFRKWVTSEVLPTLRKTGRYTMPELDPEEAYNRVGANRADIFHHRGPVSKSGLDIRYTMDLTKIALNPNPRTLDLVQRLTGVDMSDLVEEMESRLASSRDWGIADIEQFQAECLEPLPGSSESARDLYAAFSRWFNQKYQEVPHRPSLPSQRRFGQRLLGFGYQRFRTRTGVFYGNVALIRSL